MGALPIEQRTPVPFKLGQIRITAAAEDLLQRHGIKPMELLTRHQSGDGATRHTTATRVCSTHAIQGQALWIITDPTPRRSTTLGLAEELRP